MMTAGKVRGATVLLTVHNVEPHEQTPLTSLLNDAVYAFADEFVVHSERNRAQFSEKTGVDPERIHVISHPTIGPEKRGLSEATARSELGVDPEAGVVLFFGNIREYKGLDDLVRMVDELVGDVDLLIAGECWVDWDEYERLIERHDLTDSVHRFPGFIPEDDLEALFRAADVVALPYTSFDAQSGVAALANHFETVSVGYDVGGLAEQVDVAVDDRESFRASLRGAIDGDLEKDVDEDDSVRDHLRLYSSLLDAPDRTTRPVR
jgi:glycosyltransferase involved in cell wall biosynthesis